MTLHGSMQKDYPYVVKEVRISDKVARRARRGLTISQAIDRRLAELVIQLVEESEIAAEQTWSEMARIAGYTSLQEVHNANMRMAVDWVNSTLTLRSKEDPEDQDAHKSVKRDVD